MPKPVSWRELVRRLRLLGFLGPEYGGKHPFMIKESFILHIPNSHKHDIGASLLAEILRQAKISLKDWEEKK